jgi:hypothetical protein
LAKTTNDLRHVAALLYEDDPERPDPRSAYCEREKRPVLTDLLALHKAGCPVCSEQPDVALINGHQDPRQVTDVPLPQGKESA